MFSFGRRKARVGIRAAFLAGATAAVVGLGTVGSASAAPSCEGSDITGRGSSLQNIAQNSVWKVGFETGVCSVEPNTPTITYESKSSGAGLEKWNYDNKEGKINTAFSFIGTDDAPNATQISNITSVAKGASLLTIPVAQTSIAVAANPPAGCEVEALTNKDLENVFDGTILKWSQLSQFLASAGGEPNPACNFAIKRIVRKGSSGTTYQFKNYLYLIEKKPVPCVTGGEKTWAELETAGTVNETWPEDEGCATTRSALEKVEGGGGLAEAVAKTPRSIGYAALPDVKSKFASTNCEEVSNCEILSLQNNGKRKFTEMTTASPVGPSSTANCAKAIYTVPTTARVSTKVGQGLNSDWSLVFGAKLDTTLSGNGYSLCTLTYALAFNKYSGPEFSNGQEQTVSDYLKEYIVQPAGQAAIASNFYAPLPEGTTVAQNVKAAAVFAAGKIGF
jgi:ABC-type phosphate transport system substrate-binding protein